MSHGPIDSANSNKQAVMSFIDELKRRNVLRVAIAYIVTAWLLLQVADVVLNNIEAPDWVFRAILLLVALGFPFALIFAWAFELTPEGLKREHEVDRSESITQMTGRKLDFTIIGLLSIALVYFVSSHEWNRETSELSPEIVEAAKTPSSLSLLEEQDTRQSVAVLPFKDFSRAKDNEYFADGLADTLLHMLAQVKGLRVAARTSSYSFKESTDDIRQIGQKLNVDTILEGSVQKSGNTLRVIAQLIEVNNGSHLWSKTFDRPDSDIFAIQDEIATSVVDALKVTVLEGDPGFSKPATQDLEAYDLYVLGRHHLNKRNKTDLEQGLQYFQRAAEIDPNYALAYVGIADSYQLLEHKGGTYGDLSRSEVVAKAQPAIDKALSLDPNLAEAHASQGLLLGDGDVAAAVSSLARSVELNPNYAMAYMWYGNILNDVGRINESGKAYRTAYRLDPLSPVIAANAAWSLTLSGDYEQAAKEFAQIRALHPKSIFGAYQATRQSFLLGEMDQAALYNRENLEKQPTQAAFSLYMGLIYLSLGDVDAAEPWLESRRFRSTFFRATGSWDELVEYETNNLATAPDKATAYGHLAIAEMHRGNLTKAKEKFYLAEEASQSLSDYFFNSSLVTGAGLLPAIDRANLYRRLGDQQKAEEGLSRAFELIQSLREQGVVLSTLDYVEASYYSVKGDSQNALMMLRRAVDNGWRLAWAMENDLNLESLYKERDFQTMRAEIKADMAEQLARLQDWEANGKLAPIPKSLE